MKEKENTVEKREKRKLFLTDMWGWRVKERCGRDEEDKGKGGGGAEMNEGHGPRCSDKLFTSFFNTVLPAAFH